MKAIYLAIGMAFTGLLPSNTPAQKSENSISTELPCYNTTELFKSLREKYKELPILSGQASDEAKSTVSVWMNSTDKNWTIIATKKELSCVIGIGTDIKLFNYKPGQSI